MRINVLLEKNMKIITSLVLGALALLIVCSAAAQTTYPEKSIRIVIGFPPVLEERVAPASNACAARRRIASLSSLEIDAEVKSPASCASRAR